MDTEMIWEEQFLAEIAEKFSWLNEKIYAPYVYAVDKDGKYYQDKNAGYSWVCGFYCGIQWWMYRLTHDDKYLNKAVSISKWMDGNLSGMVHISHDLGFQYLLTTVPDYLETGAERALKTSIHAATLLAGRFNLAGRYIRAWDDNKYIDPENSKAGYCIIDSMMNLPLLFWAAKEIADPRFSQIAVSHADTVMKEFIRPDGSSEHIVVFDPNNGQVVCKPEGQGYAPGSSWTRGQAWAIYGFAMAYHYSNDEKYYDTSLKVAEYYMSNMGDEIPPVDFNQPPEPDLKDASSAAVAVCGLIELKKYADRETAEKLEMWIVKLLHILHSDCDFSNTNEAILQSCKQMYHESPEQTSLIYADFYLLEALMKRRGDSFLFE